MATPVHSAAVVVGFVDFTVLVRDVVNLILQFQLHTRQPMPSQQVGEHVHDGRIGVDFRGDDGRIRVRRRFKSSHP